MADVRWHERSVVRNAVVSHRDQHRDPRSAYWCGPGQATLGTWLLYERQPTPTVSPFRKAGGRSPFELINYAGSKLSELRSLPDDWDNEGGKAVSADALISMHEVLGRVVERTTVFPFLSPNGEGGVLAEWHAGSQKIEIEVEADGTAYTYATDNQGKVVLDTNVSRETIKALRHILRVLSERVDEENPKWREMFSR